MCCLSRNKLLLHSEICKNHILTLSYSVFFVSFTKAKINIGQLCFIILGVISIRQCQKPHWVTQFHSVTIKKWGQMDTAWNNILFPSFSSSLYLLEAKSASWLFILDFTTPASKYSLVCWSMRCVHSIFLNACIEFFVTVSHFTSTTGSTLD